VTALEVRHVSHAFGANRVLRDVSVTVAEGELVCLLGPSGAGKTTLLRLVAGLERLQKGEITIAGETVAAPGRHRPPETRGIGLMFQDFALFPHLSVIENVAFGLKGTENAQERARRMLMMVGLESHGDHYPHELSGGQQQRVALARALAPNPRLMLLDEPFSGLDTTLRAQVREETTRILKAANTSTLMVTHDPEEAMGMADRIKVMDSTGRVVQTGTPAELYYEPANSFVAALFGPVNRIEGTVQEGKVTTPFGDVPAPDMAEGEKATVLIRPEAFSLNGRGTSVEVVSSRLLGRTSRLEIRPREETVTHSLFTASLAGPAQYPAGETLEVSLSSRHVFVFPAGPDARSS